MKKIVYTSAFIFLISIAAECSDINREDHLERIPDIKIEEPK